MLYADEAESEVYEEMKKYRVARLKQPASVFVSELKALDIHSMLANIKL